jgi:catechol 2,3-dioxygenase-like lactoylglutathione lyase family enzyme
VVTGIHHLTLRVRDLTVSARFYEDALSAPSSGSGTNVGFALAVPSLCFASLCLGRPPTTDSANDGSPLTISPSSSSRRQSLKNSRNGSSIWASR